MESELNYKIEDQEERIIITGDIDQIIATLKAIFEAIYPKAEYPKRDVREIDIMLMRELHNMKAYSRGDIGVEELRKLPGLPQLTFGPHRITFDVDSYGKYGRPGAIIARYFANASSSEGLFKEVISTFRRAIQDLKI